MYKVPEIYTCQKLSYMVMREPVAMIDGHIYERDYIEDSIAQLGLFSPVTRKAITNEFNELVPLRTAIDEELSKHTEIFADDAETTAYIPRSFWMKLRKAISGDDLGAFKDLVAKDPRLLFLTPQTAVAKGLTLAVKPDNYELYAILSRTSNVFSWVLSYAPKIRKFLAEKIADLNQNEKESAFDWALGRACQSNIDNEGNTMLHFIAEAGNRKASIVLMQRFELNPNAKNSNGDTPLIRLARVGKMDEHYYAAVELLKNRANIYEANAQGNTVLHEVIDRRVAILVHSYDAENKLLTTPNLRGAYPLDKAKLAGRECIFEGWNTLGAKTNLNVYDGPQLFLATLDGKIKTIRFPLTASVGLFKEKIAGIENIPEKDMRLIFCGRQFDDDAKTLEEQGLCKESTVHICLRLCGD